MRPTRIAITICLCVTAVSCGRARSTDRFGDPVGRRGDECVVIQDIYYPPREPVPPVCPERSTAAGMFQSLFGMSAVSGSLLSGITGAFGYKVVVLVAAAFAVAGTLVFWNAPDDG